MWAASCGWSESRKTYARSWVVAMCVARLARATFVGNRSKLARRAETRFGARMLPKYPGRVRSWLRVRCDPIAFLTEVARTCGDFARFDVLAVPFVFVNDPAVIREALVEKSDLPIIRGGASAGLPRLIGPGIL